jgi:hypothetical protein
MSSPHNVHFSGESPLHKKKMAAVVVAALCYIRFLTFLQSLFCISGESLLHTKKVAAAAAAAVRVENKRSAAAAATSAMDYMCTCVSSHSYCPYFVF